MKVPTFIVRGYARTQLLDPDGGACHRRAQYVPNAERRTLNAEVQAPTCDLVTTPSAWPRRTLDLIQKIRP
jgi:hypothetical protein